MLPSKSELRDPAQQLEVADGRSIVLLDRLAKQSSYGAEECARNVFLLDQAGRILWQVRTAFDAEGAPFTNILFDGVELKGYRWDGGHYLISLENGHAIPATLAK
jgi:hypothetical protein